MFKTILAATFAIALALPATAVLASPPKDCVLSQVTSVQPLQKRVGRVDNDEKRLVGATLFVPAQPGLTTDWLKRLADEHQARMAQGESMKDCVFGVPNSHVEVSSNGSGYLMVGVQSNNLDGAKEILRRAKLMVK